MLQGGDPGALGFHRAKGVKRKNDTMVNLLGKEMGNSQLLKLHGQVGFYLGCLHFMAQKTQ